MAKISPVSIKYMIHASFVVEGSLEKPDVIGAIFGQTEGLLGADLEMRELQKEGKIGRIEVDLEKKDKRTIGTIQIPTAIDQSETTLIAAAVETIDKIGPSDAQIEIEKIEDVRGSKRDYILDRAKKLMGELQGGTDSRSITQEIKDSTRTSAIQEYGDEKLPCGDLTGKEIIVVEGRADVVNMLKNGVDNVIAMNGTKLPQGVIELGKSKDLVLFVDGDRGGKLIVQNVSENTNVKAVSTAPDGKEVEELTGKEILMSLRKRFSVKEFLSMQKWKHNNSYEKPAVKVEKTLEIGEEEKKALKNILDKAEGSGKAVLLDADFGEIKEVSTRGFGATLSKLGLHPAVVVIDGSATKNVITASEESGVQAIVAKNFATTDTAIKLLSL